MSQIPDSRHDGMRERSSREVRLEFTFPASGRVRDRRLEAASDLINTCSRDASDMPPASASEPSPSDVLKVLQIFFEKDWRRAGLDEDGSSRTAEELLTYVATITV